MAQRIVLTDDLDGGEPAYTVAFALDGQDYEIELTDDNIKRLWELVEPYVKAARRKS